MNRKDVYLCYNSADRQWVESLATQLESETVDGLPGSRKLSVFFDQWDMDVGDSLIAKMNEGLRTAQFVVTVLSPEFLAAPWPEFEWKHIVAADPTNAQGRLIPIVLRESSLDSAARIELVAPFRDLKWLDFTNPSQFKRSFAHLVRRVRGEPNPRGAQRPPIVPGLARQSTGTDQHSSWYPDRADEHLLSNLLTVASMPTTVFGAATSFRKKQDVWDAFPTCSPFILKNEMLFSFANLKGSNEELSSAVDAGNRIEVSTTEWLHDKVRSKWLVELLNGCLAKHFWEHGLKKMDGGRFFFPPSAGSDLRKVKTPSGFHRSVASNVGDVGSRFWVHLACRAKFVIVGDEVAVWVEPGFLFTVDGYSSIIGKAAGKLSQMWSGKQQNDQILRDLLFWFDILRGINPNEGIPTGASPIFFASAPLSAKADFGVEGDQINFRALRKMESGDDLKAIAEQIS